MIPRDKIILAGGLLLLGGAGIAVASRAVAKAASSSASSSFGLAVLARARADLGVIESAPNTGPRVQQMLRNVGVNVPANWCAAAVATWIQEAAAELGRRPPIRGSASVLATVQQFQDANNAAVGWLEASALRAKPSLIAPGMIVAWTRGGAGSGMGHIGVVETSSGERFGTIEGNAGAGADRVVRSDHDLSADSLLGMGYFKDSAIAGVGYYNPPPGAALFLLC